MANKHKILAVNLPPELRAKIRERAKKGYLNESDFVREVLRQAVRGEGGA